MRPLPRSNRDPQSESVLGSRSPRDDPSRAGRRRHGPARRAARTDRPSPTVLPRRVRRPPRRDVPDRRDRRHAVPAVARRRGAGVAGARVRPGVAQRLRGVGAVRRAVVPADRRGRLPAPRRERRVLPALSAGDPRALVRPRRSPLRGGDDRVERRLLGRPGRHLPPDHLRAVRTHRPHHGAADVRVPDRALLPDALQRVAVPPALRHGVLGSPPSAMVGRGRRRGAGGAHPQHRGRDRAGARDRGAAPARRAARTGVARVPRGGGHGLRAPRLPRLLVAPGGRVAGPGDVPGELGTHVLVAVGDPVGRDRRRVPLRRR